MTNDALEQRLAAIEARLERLESRQAFQDDAQNTLSDALAAHGQDILRLRQQLETLTQRLTSALEQGRGSEGPEPPPPHY
ncbi:MAG: SlyX family protein [Pseudomonadota bacterium]